jgi:hypothetical protein
MRFHAFVRGTSVRLAAALLAVLLAGPDIASRSPSLAAERAASSTHDDGMAPTPTHTASAEMAIAPVSMAASPASATPRVLVNFQPLVCRTITDKPSRVPAAVRPAPTVLRV